MQCLHPLQCPGEAECVRNLPVVFALRCEVRVDYGGNVQRVRTQQCDTAGRSQKQTQCECYPFIVHLFSHLSMLSVHLCLLFHLFALFLCRVSYYLCQSWVSHYSLWMFSSCVMLSYKSLIYAQQLLIFKHTSVSLEFFGSKCPRDLASKSVTASGDFLIWE